MAAEQNQAPAHGSILRRRVGRLVVHCHPPTRLFALQNFLRRRCRDVVIDVFASSSRCHSYQGPSASRMNFGADTAGGKDFQQQRMSNGTVDNVNLPHTSAERFQAGFDFWNHSTFDHALVN